MIHLLKNLKLIKNFLAMLSTDMSGEEPYISHVLMMQNYADAL